MQKYDIGRRRPMIVGAIVFWIITLVLSNAALEGSKEETVAIPPEEEGGEILYETVAVTFPSPLLGALTVVIVLGALLLWRAREDEKEVEEEAYEEWLMNQEKRRAAKRRKGKGGFFNRRRNRYEEEYEDEEYYKDEVEENDYMDDIDPDDGVRLPGEK